MKKLIRVLLVLTLAFVLTTCGSDKAEETKTDAPTEAAGVTGDLSGEVTITGSTSVASIVEELRNEFEANNPNVSIAYTGTGSSAGVEDSINAVNDLGVASRALKDEEIVLG